MTPDEIKKVIVEALTRIAPEISPASIRPDVQFRDDLDLDSIDFLNFVLALHERLGVDIPAADYSKLSTLDRAVQHLVAKASTHRTSSANPGTQA